jgi:2-keto-4-pentenoate hydratase/2-oxohepta-3-ene-1,7-dioic acid hydratase in catechol pathway
MRFARYEFGGVVIDGVAGPGDRLHRLAPGQDIDDLIRGGGLAALLDAGTAALGAAPGPAVADVRLLPPLHPASIRDSVSFEAHIEGARKSQEGARDPVPERWYAAPCFYFTNPHACIGAFDDVERFPGSELFDLELEVGVVYGAHGRNLTPEQAAAGIVGYTIFNDWSARDIQRLEGQLPFGFFKGKDGVLPTRGAARYTGGLWVGTYLKTVTY